MAQAVARWSPLLKSLAVHGVILALLGSGWWMVRREPPAQQVLAIEATVVDARDVGLGKPRRAPPAPAPAREPEPAPPPPEPAPQPSPDVEREAEAQRERAAAEKAAAEKAADDKVARERELVAKRAEAERREADAARAAEKKEAERKAAEKARAESERKLAEKKAAEREAAEKKEAERKAADKARADADAKQRAEHEAELRRQLAAEERAMAARAGGLGVQWAAAIQARIQRAWIRPASARAGLDCTVAVTQVPGGEVVAVRVLSCNGDDTVRQSIEAAVYRASPLPPPPDPSLFERNLEVRFKPND
jgi:colicin import membrane protein